MSPPTPDELRFARTSPAGFAWFCTDGRWVPAEHLLLLSQKLCDVAAGRTKRLMVFMPPRHGKSELISKFMPAWYLGRFPDRKVMLTSYADTFAASWGRKAREVMEEFGPPVFGVGVSSSSKSAQQWELQDHDGVMVTAGIGGGITGKGGHLLIIDDPVKNAEEAHSEKTQEAHMDWWRSTARTRLQAGAGVVLVMTRWHQNDLAGQLLRAAREDDGDEWEVLTLPGLAEPGLDADDPLGRAEGDALWPEMFPVHTLEATRRAQGNYWFTAMYQQRPSPAEGALFRRPNFRYFDVDNSTGLARMSRDSGTHVFDPGYGIRFCTVDVAASSKQQSDYTVIGTWIITPDRDLLLWDVQRAQFDSLDVGGFVRRVYDEHSPAFIAVERQGFGLTVIQELLREGLPVIRLEADTDKVSRALPAVARYEEHRIYHRRGTAWLEPFEFELLSFPNGTNDDQVDMAAYAAAQLPMVATPHAGGLIQKSRGKTITGGLLSDLL